MKQSPVEPLDLLASIRRVEICWDKDSPAQLVDAAGNVYKCKPTPEGMEFLEKNGQPALASRLNARDALSWLITLCTGSQFRHESNGALVKEKTSK